MLLESMHYQFRKNKLTLMRKMQIGGWARKYKLMVSVREHKLVAGAGKYKLRARKHKCPSQKLSFCNSSRLNENV